MLSLPLERSYSQIAIWTINFRFNLILVFHPRRTAFQEDRKASMSRMLVLYIQKQHQIYSFRFFVCQLVFKGTVTKKLVLSEKNRSTFSTTVNIRRNKFYSSNYSLDNSVLPGFAVSSLIHYPKEINLGSLHLVCVPMVRTRQSVATVNNLSKAGDAKRPLAIKFPRESGTTAFFVIILFTNSNAFPFYLYCYEVPYGC